MPNREGGSAFRRGATKHQIKKVMRVVSKMTKILSLFLFSFFFLKKFKKRRGGRRLGREGIASLVVHVFSLFTRRDASESRARTHATYHQLNRASSVHFSCVRNVSVVVVVVLPHETKERYKREPIFEKNQPLNRQPS